MTGQQYDIIVIGSGSGGLSVGLFMSKAGFRVLMISKSDRDIGGDCLNDGCVPSKALIHVSEIINNAKLASGFGLDVAGKPDFEKVMDYVRSTQGIIRKHENAEWLRNQGISVALGTAYFVGKNEVAVDDKIYSGKKIVIATGSTPSRLSVPGIEKVSYLDNENIFELKELPKKLLVVGGGPVGVELAQALSRLGTIVTLVHSGKMILDHDEHSVAGILLSKLRDEGITVELNARVQEFISNTEAIIKRKDESNHTLVFDAVFAAVGRDLNFKTLSLEKAGIVVKNDKISINKYLRTSNKNVFVCGDVAGDLMFSHAAEFHARILINNFFSPFKKKIDNRNMSWVIFTDPQLATFGLNEIQLGERHIRYLKTVQDFDEDDRAVVGNYRYARLILYLTPRNIFGTQKILGGTMVAPGAGELIQELILAHSAGVSLNTVFNKIYPYPVASRINQQLVVKLKEASLNASIKRLLKTLFRLFG